MVKSNEKTRLRIGIWVKSVGVILLVAAMLFVGNLIYAPKWLTLNNPQTLQIDEFRDVPEGDLDVLVLGSCQVYQGINPCVLWDDYRLTSYVLAGPDMRMYSTCYYLEYALETQKPRYLVIDAMFLVHGNEPSDGFDKMALHSMPLSDTKMAFSDFLFDLTYGGERDTVQYQIDRVGNRIATVMPFFAFNNRFDISVSDITYYTSYENRVSFLGGVPMFETMDLSSHADYMEEPLKYETIDESGDEYFRKITELCRENGIQIIVIKTLCPYYWNRACSDSVSAYLDGTDIPYIDFNIDTAGYGLNLSEHLYERWKLNDAGMTITTKYIGEYITSKPDYTPGQVSDGGVALYDGILAKYQDVAGSAVWKQTEIPEWTRE